MNKSLPDKIIEYINLRLEDKLLAENKKFNKRQQVTDIDQVKLAEEKANRLNELREQYKPANWLTNAVGRVNQITMATHVLKYTHSDAKGSSYYACRGNKKHSYQGCYLSTSDVNVLEDVVGNAAALDVAAFLQLESEGKRLLDYIKDGNASPLSGFAENEQQLDSWLRGLKQVFKNEEIASHTLAKQVYFPVAKGQYHLISPLFPSSVTQVLYERIMSNRYSEEMKLARKARKEGKYYPGTLVYFPALAVQHFGGSKPQNISQLNSSRRGISFLLKNEPPIWHKRKLPVLYKTHSFWQAYETRVWKTLKDFKTYLVEIKGHRGTINIRNRRQAFVENLINHLMQFAAEIINNKEAGWSQKSDLSLQEKLWLDPYNPDESFQQLRIAGDWKETIYQKFAFWLNNKLAEADLNMKDEEYKAWYRELKKVMSLLKDDLEAMTE